KSLQLLLNEMMMSFDSDDTVSNSAFTQARANLYHTAFIELNRKAVVDVMYSDDNIRLYKGMRVSGIDGSKVLLPDTPDIINEFDQISCSNDHPDVTGSHACGLASVMYDVLNGVAADSVLGTAGAYEVELAIGHPAHSRENDLLLYDRNYPSYFHLSFLCQLNKKFVIRCSAASFAPARKMLNGEGPDSQIVTLKPSPGKIKEIKDHDLPEEITVRFVRVTLSTGEYEVLVTSLPGEAEFPNGDFLHIYYLRRGAEGFYGIIKTRLNLENFSGKTAEPVYQDFYAAVYLSGLESILTADTNEQPA
ncbi:MAG: IS4 family transposase, partial [Gammaproteobacteria bacterium]|nr:IS4 family transposase [Gammaproteobacteria bacterium]